MKVSLNFVNKISNQTIVDENKDELIKKVGLQLGAIEDIENWSEKYQGATIVEVVECIKHPNADKLSVCKVNDNNTVSGVERDENGLVQVVCGAPNVQKGVLAVWLPPQTVIPSTFGAAEPIRLESREIRGEVSNGMMASPDELGLNGGHDGLLLLDKAEVGQSFAELYGLSDVVLDLENKMFTHRPDCFGVLGVARELAGIQGKAFTSPAWYLNKPNFINLDQETLPINVSVESDLVPRFMAVAMSGITVSESPEEIKAILTLSGIKPINNIVDITNYISQLTAQPLHAYDYDKLVAASNNEVPTLSARNSIEGEKVTLLGGKEINLKDNQSVVIATDKQVVGLGGVMGGMDTEVDFNTKNIVIECASFDMYNIRKTSMKYGLFTDAVTRYNKGQSPLQNDRILAQAMSMFEVIAGGKQASNVIDIVSSSLDLEKPRNTVVSVDKINQLLGHDFTAQEIINILGNVELTAISQDNDFITLEIPFWRTDIALVDEQDGSLESSVANADIAEEVGRLYGYHKLPVQLPKRRIAVAKKNELFRFKEKVRSILVAEGANELLTYNFVSGSLLKKVNQDEQKAFKISNALSPNLQYYRLSLLPSLIEKTQPNIKSGFDNFALFEIGKAHSKDNIDAETKLPNEVESLALIVANKQQNLEAKAGEPYYWARAYLDELFARLNIELVFKPLENDNDEKAKLFYAPRSAKIQSQSGELIGYIGEFNQEVKSNFKLPQYCAGFEIDLVKLHEISDKSNRYQEISKFPKVEQDITLQVKDGLLYFELRQKISDFLNQVGSGDTSYKIELIDIYSPDQETRNYTFRVTAISHNSTLSSAEINKILDNLALDLGRNRRITRI